ncbi:MULTISPECIES: AzlD domain-containing protein [unclassified Roseivivax]|uniref:AzlD domain-containing protein n=1 Tax=Roseivivax sp. GX 12232 TaxID=2900547 RepID=UPI001E2A7B56|nr:AzlD domain-containing protein [Roseivivax sp. GX 12232]MCE0504472.1 AzlD domain-containing protein [Roseivivax sp. GX 12232]
MIDTGTLWIVIVGLGLGSFGMRFLFLGLVGDREMPPWVLRHLRYTAVAVLPALIAPLVIWPRGTGGEFEPVRFVAALVTFAVGYWSKNVPAAMLTGAAVLGLGLGFLG